MFIDKMKETEKFKISRALILGTLLIAMSCYWVVGAENRIIWELTDFSLYPTVIFVIFLVALVNLALRRYLKGFSLPPGELAIIYVMLSIATSLYGHDMMRQLIPMMTNPFWFATPENEWEDLFFRYIPRWLAVDNLNALEGYYKGESSFFMEQHIRAWLIPILSWTAFIVVFLFGMLCVNLIVRKQWAENEKLSYPIIQLPIEMSSTSFFASKLMWIGLGITVFIELLAGLNYLYPVIPAPGIKWDVGQHLTSKPWNAMSPLYMYIYGFAVGLAYFMPLSLSFSLWFFYLFWKFQLVFFSIMGWPTGGGWQGDQRFGAWIGIGLIVLYTSRKHIKDTIITLIRRKENDELYRLAYFGIIFSIAFMLYFWYHAGSSIWAISLYLGIYMVLSIAITRMRAELGPPTHELHSVEPDRMMIAVVGTRRFGANNLTTFTMLDWIAYGYRCHPMPHQLEGLKIGERLNIKKYHLVIALMLAALVGTLGSFLAHLGFYYKYPNYAVWGIGPFSRLGSWLSNPVSRDLTTIRQMSFGFLFTTFLTIMSRRYLWWPFQPVGYACGAGWAIGWMWFSVFLSWLAKRIILAYGGSKVYKAAVPFFLGLILGQFFMGSLWSVIGLILNKGMYTLFP